MNQIITSERIPIKLWLNDIEPSALKQARNLANLPFAYKWIAIMPDAHQGFGMPIGGVLATKSVIVPNAVGVDIGCGLLGIKTSITDIDDETIKKIIVEIKRVIPLGFEHQKTDQQWIGFYQAPDDPIIQTELSSARRQLGTLGGGNHFIEIQKGNDDHIWIMLHSGSRNFGYKVAEYYNKQALKINQQIKMDLQKDLFSLDIDHPIGRDYFRAMKYCCEFAKANRQHMMDRIWEVVLNIIEVKKLEEINIHHNYAEIENHFGRDVVVHRKGAIKASKNTIGIIPGSMGTPSFIVNGLGNPESFESSSHGAGRMMERKEAVRSLDLSIEQKKMRGIIHGLRAKGDLEEAPGAYKDILTVMDNQKDLVEITDKLVPLGSIKG